ncbi:MAG: hypothetical protein QM691_09645 [Opitutaceae bacterium]
MNALTYSLRRSTCLLTCLGVAATAGRLGAAAAEMDPFQAYSSYIKISGQSAAITGNDAAYATRRQTSPDGSVGIEDLHLARDLDANTALTVDGRALFGDGDYLAKVNLARNEVGSVEIGYKRFRTFYDGIGGFFPHNAYWQPLAKEELHTDRGNFWADLKIARPNAPVIQLRFSDERRTGEKDSTIWGDTDFTDIPIWNKSALNPVSSNRKLVPSYIELNERLRTYLASVSHTIGKTSFAISLVRAETDNTDTRWINRYPGELRPYPAIPSSASAPNILVAPAQVNNAIYGFDEQSVESRATTLSGEFETRLNDHFTIFGGVRHQSISADLGADRELTTDIMTATGKVSAIGGFSVAATGSPSRPPYSFTSRDGHATEKILSGNFGVRMEPVKALFVTLAFKGEDSSSEARMLADYINTKVVLGTGAVTSVPIFTANTSETSETAWTPEIDVRYSGIKNLSLYANFDYRHVSGDESASNGAVTISGTGLAGTVVAAAPIIAEDNTGENHGHYKIGANWNACSALTLRSELFYRDHRNSFADLASSTDGFFLGYRYRGWKVSGTVRPAPGLSFTTRYVQQVGEADVTVDDGDSYDSMDSRNHLIGETIDWAPTKQVYFQANLNVVFATLRTAYPRAGGSANDVLRNADNNYWSASFVSGLAVGPSTNLELQAAYYRADNYQSAMVASVPYGAEAKESSVAVAVKHAFTDRIRGTLKVGYFDRQNVTTGGFTNFRGPMAYLSLEHAL